LTEPTTDYVNLNGEQCRVWRKGDGPALIFLAGHGGMPKWIPFLDALAENFEVVVPSLPGYPGAEGHRELDTHMDWILAARELIGQCGAGADALLMGAGPGGSFAAEIAAVWPGSVSRLALIAPWGLYDETMPMGDPWSQRSPDFAPLLCENPDRWAELTAMPEGANSTEWPIAQTRALEASARAFWPLGKTGLERRLHRIDSPTLLLWGEKDKVVPPSYAEKFSAGIAGEATVKTIPGAGHLAYLDAPDEVAAAVAGFIQ